MFGRKRKPHVPAAAYDYEAYMENAEVSAGWAEAKPKIVEVEVEKIVEKVVYKERVVHVPVSSGIRTIQAPEQSRQAIGRDGWKAFNE